MIGHSAKALMLLELSTTYSHLGCSFLDTYKGTRSSSSRESFLLIEGEA